MKEKFQEIESFLSGDMDALDHLEAKKFKKAMLENSVF